MGTPNDDGGDMLRYQRGLKYERISQIIACDVMTTTLHIIILIFMIIG